MPWSNQGGGGGPWGQPPGGGSQGPWGRPSGGGGQNTPDLEDLLRRGQDRVKRMVPGGFGSGKGIVLIIGILIAVWLASGFYRIEPDEQGVVLRFGEWVRTEQPGLRYHLPFPIEEAYRPKVTKVQRIDIGYRSNDINGRRSVGNRDVPDESLMLTGDENIIDIDFTVFWVIKDAGNYLFKIRNPEATVKKGAESAMREVIGKTDLQPALTEKRQEIEMKTRTLLQDLLNAYQSGIEITQVQMQDSSPPEQVVDAFNDVQRARADRERLANEAEAYRNDIIPRARGEAERMIQEAEAYKEEVVNLASGDANRFKSVYDAYSIGRDVAARRMYLETMEDVLGDARKVVIDPSSAGEQGVVPYLPLNELQRASGQTRSNSGG